MTRRHHIEIKKAAERQGCTVVCIERTRHTHVTVERGSARRVFTTPSTPDKVNSAWLFERDLKRWIKELEHAAGTTPQEART